MNVPLVEPRSFTKTDRSLCTISQCALETDGSSSWNSFVLARPTRLVPGLNSSVRFRASALLITSLAIVLPRTGCDQTKPYPLPCPPVEAIFVLETDKSILTRRDPAQ